MSSATAVPETTRMAGEQLTADDAWRTVRGCGWTIWREAFARFRYGDGFSHARALGLQLCLAFIPLVIALVGLSGTLATERIGEVLRLTLVSLSPGASDALLRSTLERPVANGDDGAEVALWFGLDDDAVAVVALPVGVALLLVAITTMLRRAPYRRQPGPSWLGLGTVVALVLWLVFTALLVGYVSVSRGFGAVYGPLTGVIALLLWAQLTSVAIFFGLAVAAQLEALRAGVRHGAAEPIGAHDG